MNSSSVYIGLAIVVLISLPFIIVALRGRAKSKNVIRNFQNTGLKYGIEISETETWNDRVIGLDPVSKKLLFSHTYNNELTETLIDLALVETCTREISYLKSVSDDKAIESVRLIFRMRNGKNTESLSIYDSDQDLNVYSEVQTAEKWTRLINELLH